MTGDTLFVGWGPVVRGRELKALEVFGESMEYYGKLQQEGSIESFETVLLTPHGGDLAGFVLLRGERSKLDQVNSSDEFQRLTARAGMIVDKVGVVSAFTGDALATAMGRFQQASQELGG